jgi:hypothetical protein
MFVRTRIVASTGSRIALRGVHVEARLEQLGIKLPPPPTPKGSYRNFVRMGNVGFLAGHLPQPIDGPMITGVVGDTVSDDEAKAAARIIGKKSHICIYLFHKYVFSYWLTN